MARVVRAAQDEPVEPVGIKIGDCVERAAVRKKDRQRLIGVLAREHALLVELYELLVVRRAFAVQAERPGRRCISRYDRAFNKRSGTQFVHIGDEDRSVCEQARIVGDADDLGIRHGRRERGAVVARDVKHEALGLTRSLSGDGDQIVRGVGEKALVIGDVQNGLRPRAPPVVGTVKAGYEIVRGAVAQRAQRGEKQTSVRTAGHRGIARYDGGERFVAGADQLRQPHAEPRVAVVA